MFPALLNKKGSILQTKSFCYFGILYEQAMLNSNGVICCRPFPKFYRQAGSDSVGSLERIGHAVQQFSYGGGIAENVKGILAFYRIGRCVTGLDTDGQMNLIWPGMFFSPPETTWTPSSPISSTSTRMKKKICFNLTTPFLDLVFFKTILPPLARLCRLQESAESGSPYPPGIPLRPGPPTVPASIPRPTSPKPATAHRSGN